MRGGRIFGDRLEDKAGTLTLKITATLWWERGFDGVNERHVNDCEYETMLMRDIESIYNKNAKKLGKMNE